MSDAIVIRPATTPQDFAAVAALLARMEAWDLQVTTALTGAVPDLAELYDDADPESLTAIFTGPGAGMMLADRDGTVLGCAGFSPLAPGRAELRKVWVEEAARGLGLGARLMDAILPAMALAGHQVAVLETATFMEAAIRLYQAKGFRPAEPFRPPFNHQSLFFARDLTL